MCESTVTYCHERGCEADEGRGCTGHMTRRRDALIRLRENQIERLRAENERLRAERDAFEDALRIIRRAHPIREDRPGSGCAEGCGGRWPCVAYAEANAVLPNA